MMSNQQIQGPDAESLSALFDGQLSTDAERFALKRLGQDAQWREACGRWQLVGDVLRGNSVAPAASGFADRLMLAVAQERGLSQQELRAPERHAFAGVSATRRRSRRHPRWMGGALAASVAIAALLVARPMLNSDDAAVDASTGREVASASPDSKLKVAAAAESHHAADSIAPDSGSPDGIVAGVAAAAVPSVAVGTDTPRRTGRRRPPADAPAVAVSRAPLHPDASLAAVERAGSHQATLASENLGEARARPFMPAGSSSKAWPRAVVSGYPSDVAMTAGFHVDDRRGDPISFYPFEPAGLRGASPHISLERGPLPTPQPLSEPAAGANLRN